MPTASSNNGGTISFRLLRAEKSLRAETKNPCNFAAAGLLEFGGDEKFRSIKKPVSPVLLLCEGQ